MISSAVVLGFAALLAPKLVQAQVTATFPNGVTNPPAPSMAAVGSTVNQTSMSRLLSLNGVDDFCVWGPPEPGPDSVIGNVEPIVVAYCTKPRNGARLIPDGTIHSAHFVKTDQYVQINGLWDGTRVNIPYGDYGGELDPHGAQNLGNPVGGNVTSNVSGKDVFYEEWMSFVSFDQYCIRICTRQEPGDVPVNLMCEHELDVMGCAFVMPSVNQWNNNSFTSCEADVGAAPGLYPQSNGSTSTFRQRYTGSYTQDGTVAYWTVGQESTPAAPFTTPAVSSCTTYSTISNGINTADYRVVSQAVLAGAPVTQSGSTTAATTTASGSSSATGSRSGSGSGSSASTARSTGASAAPTTAAAAATSGAANRLETGFGGAGALGGMVLAGLAVLGGGVWVLA